MGADGSIVPGDPFAERLRTPARIRRYLRKCLAVGIVRDPGPIVGPVLRDGETFAPKGPAMGTTFFPSTDVGLLAWSTRFASVLAEDPQAYGVPDDVVAAFVVLQAEFAEAYARSAALGTRSKVDTTTKNEVRERLKMSARRVASVIAGQPDVTDAQRIAIGLTVSAGRTASAVPGAARLAVSLGLHHTVTITLDDAGVGFRTRWPDGVVGAVLMRHVGDDPPTAFDDFKFVGLIGRPRVEVHLGSDVPSGATVWFTAAFFNARKELGPAATAVPVRLTIEPAVNAGRAMTIRRRAA